MPEPDSTSDAMTLMHGKQWRLMRKAVSPFFSKGKNKQVCDNFL